jgi:hypothetical protein
MNATHMSIADDATTRLPGVPTTTLVHVLGAR